MFLTSAPTLRLSVKTISFERIGKGIPGNPRPERCNSWWMVAFKWNLYHCLKDSTKSRFLPYPAHPLPSVLSVFILLLERSTMVYWLCLPLELYSPRYFLMPHILYVMYPSFLISLYKIALPTNRIPLPYFIFHLNTWHLITHLFDNLFITLVSHWNGRPTRAGTLPTSLLYPSCLEQDGT